MPGIGHNQGPTMQAGHGYRTHMWRRAQQKLMPNAVPLMIVRMRVRRAAELGMDYKTYAAVRQFSGQDILGLLFSSNALRIITNGAKVPAAQAEALAAVKSAKRLSLVHAPYDPPTVLQANPVLDATGAAPKSTESWSQMRARVGGFINQNHLSGNQVLIIGDTSLEQEWAGAARAAGYLSALQYFNQLAE